ncbi:MAG: Y-family DNA polymerase [Bacteroidales bacterium]|nr:Y-family DNA polymerase [Bacteroidales bacterium]MDD4655836.1 Y-family DNA polymerase [Bacteroidales bacterium]
MYGLADCNNFYVSCERLFNPSLNGKPVIVLSNNDGCVISRSQEAKRLGIRMGEPLFKIKDLIKRENVKVFSSNFALYGDISSRVMNTLAMAVPSTEVYSIDEAFLNLEGIEAEEVKKLVKELAFRVKKNTGIPVSIGVSNSKTLAKIATKLCKIYPKLNNSCVMYRQKEIDKVLKKFPIEDVWGIGRRYSQMLNRNGVTTASDFVSLSPVWVKSKMKITGLKTWKELNSEPCFSIEENVPDKQQICTSRSFAKDLYNHEEVIMAVAEFTTTCARKLRAQNGVVSRILLFAYTNPFKEGFYRDYQSAVIPLENPTDNTLNLVSIACGGISKILKKGYGYKKAGVIFTEISRKQERTASLFYEGDLTKEANLMKSLDDVNLKYGRDTLVTASQGVDKIKSNRNNLSPRYTTSWEDIIKVIV